MEMRKHARMGTGMRALRDRDAAQYGKMVVPGLSLRVFYPGCY